MARLCRSFLFLISAFSVVCVAAEFAFDLPAVPLSVDLNGQQMTINTSGEVSVTPLPPGSGDQIFKLTIQADLGDFQSHLTHLLQTQLDKSETCGDRISITDAVLKPTAPSADLAVQLHAERWLCVKEVGRDNVRKLIGGEAIVHVTVTPRLENNLPAIDATPGAIEPAGAVANLLRTGPAVFALRDSITKSLSMVLQTSDLLANAVPVTDAARLITLQSAAFGDRGSGRLQLDLTGRMQLHQDQVSSVLERLGNGK
jgi:hypothetical protein